MLATAKCSRATTTGRTLFCVGRVSPAAPITRDVSATVRLTLMPGGAKEQQITFSPRAVDSSNAPRPAA